jgi:hypothetical protein
MKSTQFLNLLYQIKFSEASIVLWIVNSKTKNWTCDEY